MKNSGETHHAHENTTLDTISNVGMLPLETPPEWERKPKTFTDEEVLEELTDALYWAPDKVNFKFRHWTDLVEVYIGESLNYIINKNLYFKLMWDE